MYIVMSFLTYIENTLEIGINDQIPPQKMYSEKKGICIFLWNLFDLSLPVQSTSELHSFCQQTYPQRLYSSV